MVRIVGKINLGDGGGTLSTVTSSVEATTYSNPIQSVKGHHKQIQNPFYLGRSHLGEQQRYTKKAEFYIGNVACNSNGMFPNDYTIEINGENISQITIVFNKIRGEYPKYLYVDNKRFNDDDPTWTIPLTSANTHTIRIVTWNKPNMPLVISSIYTDLSIDIDDTNLMDFERVMSSKTNYKQPSFGIISNSGDVSFIDTDSEVLDLVYQQFVNSNNVITMYIEDTNSGSKEQICEFNSQSWAYNKAQLLVDVAIKDDLEEWQSINVPAINYVPTVSTSQTAEWLYKQLHAQTPDKYNMLSFDKLDEITKEILSGTTVQYPILDSDNLWAQWNKLCQLCFLNIYKNNDGQTICVYSGG